MEQISWNEGHWTEQEFGFYLSLETSTVLATCGGGRWNATEGLCHVNTEGKHVKEHEVIRIQKVFGTQNAS